MYVCTYCTYYRLLVGLHLHLHLLLQLRLVIISFRLSFPNLPVIRLSNYLALISSHRAAFGFSSHLLFELACVIVAALAWFGLVRHMLDMLMAVWGQSMVGWATGWGTAGFGWAFRGRLRGFVDRYVGLGWWWTNFWLAIWVPGVGWCCFAE